jgi:hypothetical protein
MGVSESGSTQILEQSILAKTKNQESPLWFMIQRNIQEI